MAQIKLGNLLWRPHTRPISPEDPVDVKDVNTADIKAKLEMVQSELALVKAELQEIKANQLSGDQKVQLSGNVVEVHTLVNALAIVDTNMRTANISNIVPNRNSYARFEVYVRNTLRTAVRIGFGTDHGHFATIPGKSGSAIPYTPASPNTSYAFHVVPHTEGAGSRPLRWYPIANDDVIDKLAYLACIGVGEGSNLVYRAVDQPTSGSLSIWFVGWKA